MADKTVPFAANTLAKLVDMGDGTHAERVAVGGTVATLEGLSIPAHDYVGMTYDAAGNVSSVTYKTGGSAGTTVATLTLAYDASGNLTSVTKAI